MTSRRMFDSVNPAMIPPWASCVAGYVDGRWPTAAALKAGWPKAEILPIAITAADDADCLDVENGDATPGQVVPWVARQHARGVARPCVYASAGNMGAVMARLAAAGFSRKSFRLWSAHYTVRHICGPSSCAYPAVPSCDGTQWTDAAFGRDLDESELLPDFFGTPPPPPAPHHHGEDTMMLQPGNGAETIILAAAGSASGITFGNDAAFHNEDAPALRVAVHSVAKGWSQVEHITLTRSATNALTFTEADVNMVNAERQAAGADTAVGYLLVPVAAT